MLFSFWSGEVSWMERLCVASAQSIGEEITVFTYGDRDKLSAQLGCRVGDAAAIIGDAEREEVFKLGVAHFSDLFRLQGISKGCGTWIDLDVIFIRPLPVSEYLFGWQNDDRIGNSVLRLPPDSELLKRYLSFFYEQPMRRFVMPWMPWPTKCTRFVKGLWAWVTGARQPAPKYGPAALTYFATLCGVDHLALPKEAFYPIPIRGPAITRVAEPGFIESLITPETICVHLWRSTFLSCNGLDVPQTGWLAGQVAHLLAPRVSEEAVDRRYSV